jgi:hypothetical protein
MSAIAASLIAVAGILLGSFGTFWFQQKAGRQERLRQDRLTACSEFAATVADLRRAVVAVWFRKRRKDRPDADDQAAADYRLAWADSDRLGAVAESAKFRMLLVIDDSGVRALAEAVSRHIGAVQHARDKAEVEKLDTEFAAHLSAFVAAAARLLKSTL